MPSVTKVLKGANRINIPARWVKQLAINAPSKMRFLYLGNDNELYLSSRGGERSALIETNQAHACYLFLPPDIRLQLDLDYRDMVSLSLLERNFADMLNGQAVIYYEIKISKVL